MKNVYLALMIFFAIGVVSLTCWYAVEFTSFDESAKNLFFFMWICQLTLGIISAVAYSRAKKRERA